ncbi:hypothetical protein BJ508DRAFT_332137 [Ascobolus immersus RN42]|uniref:Uncharacterized protein n=1 Tax=Ascobolus immersus RN42 TaxID=1160509 RepID=A0A3N4HNW0_ASCIM|nr:hypothetical protein BJ508DRAFT_332137 [Ascobolus immersus RN42]
MAPSTQALTTLAVTSLLNRRARRQQKATAAVDPIKPVPAKVTKTKAKKKEEVVVRKEDQAGLSTVEKNLKKIGLKDRGLGKKEEGDVRVKILEKKNGDKKKTKTQSSKKSKKESEGFVFASEDDDSDSD